jgi:hypothetical protein
MQRMIFMTFFALLISGPVWGQDYVKDLKGIKTVKIIIRDNVKGGCWSAPSSAKTFVEKELLSSGIGVSDKTGDINLSITAIGFADTAGPSKKKIGCVAYVSVQGWYVAADKPHYSDEEVLVVVEVFSDGMLLSGASDRSDQINRAIRGFAAQFAVRVMKANMGN